MDLLTTSGTAARQAALPVALRELHGRVLRAFLATGGPPQRRWLDQQAASLDPDAAEVLAALSAADLVHLADGTVTVADPFSGMPTNHVVTVDGHRPVFAMCG
jgi:hypothetical protein